MGEVEGRWGSGAGELRCPGYAWRDQDRAKKGKGEAAPEEEGVRGALHTVTDALDTALTSVGNAIRDPEVQQSAKEAAKSLLDALGTSFAQVGEALDRAVDSVRKTSQPDQAPETEPPEGTNPVA